MFGEMHNNFHLYRNSAYLCLERHIFSVKIIFLFLVVAGPSAPSAAAASAPLASKAAPPGEKLF